MEEHFHAGQAAAAQQNFSVAITEFKAVLKLDPTISQARTNLGLMYFSTGKYKEAAQQLAEVTKAAPGILAAQLFLGLSRFKLGQVDQAIGPLLVAQQRDPSNVEAARALFSYYLSLRQYGQACHQLRIVSQQANGEEGLFLASQASLQMGKELTRHLAQTFGSTKWAHRLAGDLAADRGDGKVAVAEYQAALNLDNQDADLRAVFAAASAAKSSNAPPADTYCRSPETQFPGCDSLLQKQYADVPGKVADLFIPNPGAEVIYKAIRVFTALGEAYTNDIASSFPDSARAHELRGAVERLRQNFTGALQEFQLASAKKVDDPALHNSAAEMDLLLDDEDSARKQLYAAGQLDPGNSQTEYLMAQLALKQKNTPEAILHLKAAEARNSHLLEVHALLGSAYMRSGKPELAVPELQKASAVDYHGDLHYLLFKAYRALGKTTEAEQALTVSKQSRAKSLQSAVSKISGDSTAAIADTDSH